MHIWRQRTAILLIAAYVVSGLLLEFTHHDDSALSLYSHPELASAAAGAREAAFTIDGRHQCLACSQLAQRVSTPAVECIPVEPAWIYGTLVHATPAIFVSDDHLLPCKRGPPLLLV